MGWKNERDVMTPASGTGNDGPAFEPYEVTVTNQTRYITMPYKCIGKVMGWIEGSLQDGVTVDATGYIVDFGAGNLTTGNRVKVAAVA